MAEYLAPGVYIEDKPSVAPMEGVSTSVGGFIGIAQRGKVNEPIHITSWNAYMENFAKGLNTPFMSDSDLAYAVYGFFQNGGRRCYVIRTAHETAKCAQSSLNSVEEGEPIIINAKDEGTWGNGLTLTIAANEDNSSNFDITISLDGGVVEVLSDLSNTEGDDYWVDVVNTKSTFISAVSGTLAAQSSVTFSGGNDGVSDITDTDYVNSLPMFDTVDDVNLIAIPGQTSASVISGITSYVDNRKDVFCVIDCEETATVDSVLQSRKTISCNAGELVFPWIRVTDPLSTSGKLRDCPPSGHVIGVIARTITSRGVWKAPAGTEAIVKGAIETTVYLPTGEIERLNPAGIVSIIPKANSGIVVWGARSLSPNKSMKYVSDILLDIYIKKTTYNGTQQFVFEPNAQETWNKVETTIQGFLDTLWREGGLFGETAEEAYFVECNEDLNTQAMRDAGKMLCKVGYASKKPAEFVIFEFSHQVNS